VVEVVVMAARDRMRDSAARFVEPEETIQEAFGAQTRNQLPLGLAAPLFLAAVVLDDLPPVARLLMCVAVVAIAAWFLTGNRYRIIVATDRRLLVLDAGRWTTAAARGLVGEHARDTVLGPPSGWLYHRLDLGGERLWVHRYYFSDVRRADLERG